MNAFYETLSAAGSNALRQARALASSLVGRVRATRASHRWACVCVGAALACAWALPAGVGVGRKDAARVVDEGEVDAALQRAARAALAGRDGAVLVLDAQTGRLRADVNSRLAFEEAFPPGSTVKPFTTLAALRSGAAGEHSRSFCPGRYDRGGLSIRCSHPRLKPPFTLTRALAYSCNHFFAQVGEGLNEHAFAETLDSFGFGARTGAGGVRESEGRLPQGPWRTAYALGDAPQMLVTPAQLLAAYAALFNGGRVFAPSRGAARGFVPRERARAEVPAAHRALLVEGMRGAVAYGTAERAGLTSLTPFVFGKTGTATPPEDFRTTHGWFVGLAADAGATPDAPPDSVRLVVLVFLKRATGAESAEVSRAVFEEYAEAGTRGRGDAGTRGRDETQFGDDGPRDDEEPAIRDEEGPGGEAASGESDESDFHDESSHDGKSNPFARSWSEQSDSSSRPLAPSPRPRVPASHVRVRVSRADAVLSVPLEDYVFGVLAAEGSVEDEPEALKALAVVARTYAVRNAGRHARDHYDLCDTTHCQRFVAVRDEAARPDFYELAHHAVDATAGETLRDPQGVTAEAYFSADCGGATADLRSLWGADESPAHLRGARDEFCAGLTGREWTDAIPAARLAEALRADRRTDAGARLDGVRVLRRDSSGRAALLALEGERRRVVRGWDFKIVVGRALGWNVLKSTRFEVSRAGASFVFRGRGFGHGLGLCQAGAHVMARRGASYRHILNRYLPGAPPGGAARTGLRPQMESAPPAARASTFRLVPAVFVSRTYGRGRVRAGTADDVGGLLMPAAHGQARLSLSSGNFRVSYPAGSSRREAEAALRALEAARADVSRRLASASLNAGAAGGVELFVHRSTGDFVASTGQPPWAAAAARGRRIDSQPLETLGRRGVLTTTLRHEYVHTVLEAFGGGRAPRWLAEGLAIHVAGEAALLARYRPRRAPALEELERALANPASAEQMRALYYSAHAEVAALIRREGEPAAWRRAARG